MRFKTEFKDLLGISLSVLSLILLSLIFIFLDTSFWSDEFFTMHYILDVPFNLMIHNILIDVHPLLYYFITYVKPEFFNFITYSF
jgi:hypothetical protein